LSLAGPGFDTGSRVPQPESRHLLNTVFGGGRFVNATTVVQSRAGHGQVHAHPVSRAKERRSLVCPRDPPPTHVPEKTLVMYRMRLKDSECAGRVGAGGARPIHRFEGSRPWGVDYGYSIVLGLREKLGEQLVEPARARSGLVW
jgi:hypothetical protein